MQYVIFSKKESGFWNNDSGWGNFATADRYSDEQRNLMGSVPVLGPDGVWMPAGIAIVNTVGELRAALNEMPDDMPVRGMFDFQPAAQTMSVHPGKCVDPDGLWAETDDGGDNTYVVAINVCSEDSARPV